MSNELIRKGPHVPTEERALARLKLAVKQGELEELPGIPGIPSVPRYLVTYMNSQTAGSTHQPPEQPGLVPLVEGGQRLPVSTSGLASQFTVGIRNDVTCTPVRTNFGWARAASHV